MPRRPPSDVHRDTKKAQAAPPCHDRTEAGAACCTQGRLAAAAGTMMRTKTAKTDADSTGAIMKQAS
ncbi:hypothetical protein [Paenibacillus piri]|uniref:Uncharacterized protein n=1 Tax=Paenibacillus piri TaxID=2547395 RepID=A0A4R5KYJ8_9BACL|nr:hypothetical protein [Paenibacillus piri]TDG00208.1 hypothetical protein E1757_00765 [Paenibacillus piri]